MAKLHVMQKLLERKGGRDKLSPHFTSLCSNVFLTLNYSFLSWSLECNLRHLCHQYGIDIWKLTRHCSCSAALPYLAKKWVPRRQKPQICHYVVTTVWFQCRLAKIQKKQEQEIRLQRFIVIYDQKPEILL